MFILICLLSYVHKTIMLLGAAWSSLSDWSEDAHTYVRNTGQKMYQATALCYQKSDDMAHQIYQTSTAFIYAYMADIADQVNITFFRPIANMVNPIGPIFLPF